MLEESPSFSLHCLRERTRDKKGLERIIYCESFNQKSVSDPEYFMCAFRIKLVKMNIEYSQIPKGQVVGPWDLYIFNLRDIPNSQDIFQRDCAN